jgi:hypothetical protein
VRDTVRIVPTVRRMRDERLTLHGGSVPFGADDKPVAESVRSSRFQASARLCVARFRL